MKELLQIKVFDNFDMKMSYKKLFVATERAAVHLVLQGCHSNKCQSPRKTEDKLEN